MLQFLGRGVILMRNITCFLAEICYGMYYIALGPLIPYLAEEAHKVETQYSFILICRAAGMLAGAAIFHKYQAWQSRPSYHKMLAYSFAVIIATNFFFIWSKTPFFQGFWNFLLAIHYFFLQVLINICIISLGKNVDQLLLLITACFSVGSLISPIIIRIFGISSYYIFAIVLGSLIPMILYLPSPEINKVEKNDQGSQQKMALNAKTVNLLCTASSIYVGLLIAKLAWGSSYAVMACGLTKQQATVFPSLHSGFNTVTKFVWLFIPIKGSYRLVFATRTLVFVAISTILLTKLGWARQALYFDSIFMGIFMSPIFSLIFSVSSEFGRPVTESQASKIVTWSVVGEGALTLICGSLMNISTSMYLYFSIGVCAALCAIFHYILIDLKGEKKAEKEVELLSLQIFR